VDKVRPLAEEFSTKNFRSGGLQNPILSSACPKKIFIPPTFWHPGRPGPLGGGGYLPSIPPCPPLAETVKFWPRTSSQRGTPAGIFSCPCLVKVAIIHAKTQSRAFPFMVHKMSNSDWILIIKKRKFKLKTVLESAKNRIEFGCILLEVFVIKRVHELLTLPVVKKVAQKLAQKIRKPNSHK
jgi:hypothetical protein